MTTQDLFSRQHGVMQRAFQEFCDPTINLPHDALLVDLADAYRLTFSDDDLGAPIKGMIVYRDGSRDEQVLTTRADNALDEDDPDDDTLLGIYLRGDMTDEEAAAVGIEVGSGGADCPKDDCDGTLEKTDDCSMCDVCFYSPCS